MTNTYRFIDPATIRHHWCRGMRLVPGSHRKDERSPFFTEAAFDDPPRDHEPRIDNGYPNVVFDAHAGLYRLYYTAFVVDPCSTNTPRSVRTGREYVVTDERRVGLAYAESPDGVTWTKPDLGLVELNGSASNNLLLLDAHGTGVMIDEADPDPARRFKLVTRLDSEGGGRMMAVAFSADGVRFTNPTPWPEHNPFADTHNFVFRDHDGRYAVITREWRDSLRVQVISHSDDFVHWSEPLLCARGVDAWNQLYSFAVLPIDHSYLGFGSIYHDGDRARDGWDTVDLVLMTSNDLTTWQFPMAFQPLVPRGEGQYPDGYFDAGCLYAAAPIEIDGRWYLYYMGSNGPHTGFREAGLGRVEIDLDRLAGYVPTGESGELFAGRFSLNGPELEVHADVDEGGSVRAHLVDARTQEPLGHLGAVTGRGWQRLTPPAGFQKRALAIRLTCERATVHGLRGDLTLLAYPDPSLNVPT